MIDVSNLPQYSRALLAFVWGGTYVNVLCYHNSFSQVLEAVTNLMGAPGRSFLVQSMVALDRESYEALKEIQEGEKFFIIMEDL